MTQMTAFIKKEMMELARGGKLMILLIIFVLVGIMNPAMAKLTPKIMEMMADDLANSGFVVTEVKVTAMDSWTQFYKNVPITLIITVLMLGGSFTVEYQRGTLINMVTKGLKRWKIVLSKTLMMAGVWTIGYWGCYGITYGYSAYFWDNGIVTSLAFSAFIYWLCGLWLISVIPLASAFCDTMGTVLLAVGAAYLLPTLLGMIPKWKAHMPTYLMGSMDLLYQNTVPKDYTWAIVIAGTLILFHMILGIALFNKRNLQ